MDLHLSCAPMAQDPTYKGHMSAHSSWEDLAEQLGRGSSGENQIKNASEETSVIPVPKPKGRPKGLFGCKQTRAFLKRQIDQSKKDQQQLFLRRLLPRKDSQELLPFQTRIGDSVVQSTLLQKRVCLFAQQQAHEEQLAGFDNPCLQYLFEGRRPVSTLAALAGSSKVSPEETQRPQRIGAVIVEASSHLWNCFLEHLKVLITEKGFVGLILGRRRRYDETPYRLRVDEDDAVGNPGISSKSTTTSTSVVKTLQTQFTCFALLFDPKSGNYTLFQGQVPLWLQVMESGCAEVLVQCQQKIEGLLSHYDEIASLFQLNSTLVATDRFSANLLAERVMQHEAKEKYLLLHHHCVVHKCATGEGKTLDLVSYHLSGLVATGASMRMAGARSVLRQLLFSIISERLEVRVGPPQAAGWRDFIYATFLPTSPSERGSSEASIVAHRQKCILSHFLNGDVREKGTVVHWTLSRVDRTQVLEQFRLFVVPALVPTICPLLNRSRFLNFLESIRWVGLLASHHDLFAELMARYYGTSVAPLQAQQDKERPHASYGRLSWEALADRISQSHQAFGQEPRASADMDFTAELTSQHVVDTENWDWGEYNKATREKAAKYAASSVGDMLLLISVVTAPLVGLMTSLVYLASEKFESDQDARAAQGLVRTSRIFQFANGELQEEFVQDLNVMYHEMPIWLPSDLHRTSVKVLVFRMMSRAGCIMHQLAFAFHRSSPYILFTGTCRDVLNLKPCLQDQLTAFFVEQFPDEEALMSTKSQTMLAALASQIQIDILGVESRHAGSRRVVNARSVQTWSLAAANLSAEWTTRQHVIQRAKFQVTRPQEKPAPRKRRRKLQDPGKKRKGFRNAGGAWKAFCRQYFQGRAITETGMADARRMYHQEKNNNSELYRSWKATGDAAQVASTHGVAAYPAKRKKSRQPTMDLAIWEDVRPKIQQAEQDFLGRKKQKREAETQKDKSVEEALALHESQVLAHQPDLLPIGLVIGSSQDNAARSTSRCFQCLPPLPPHPGVVTFAPAADEIAKDQLVVSFCFKM